MTQSDAERLKVLEQLESGELDFNQAMSELTGTAQAGSAGGTSSSPASSAPAASSASLVSPVSFASSAPSAATRRWARWWLLPFYFGVLAIGGGIVLANQGGGWWLLAVPLLLGGAMLTLLALASTRSPWLHVRIHNPERNWPRTIGISIPVPFRFAAWAMRSFGSLIPNLDEQAVGELLMAFELGRMIDEPLNMEFNDPDSATRVEIFLG
jgi:hypothetical protein